MKSHTYHSGGYNNMFTWGYVEYEGIRSIWVHSYDNFGVTCAAIINDFGDLVRI